jgi:anaerobic ribonucleoside-triphosphate reductase activating protein
MDFNWILINNYKYPITVLGPGERIAVWTQGCSIRCKGCMSKHTWEFNKNYKKNIKEFIHELNQYNCKSITISGGEPFDQINFLFFLKELRNNGFDDILVYSGYPYNFIKQSFKKCLFYIDVLISEPFESGNESLLAYKGSDNQKAIIFNKKIFNKYKKFLTSKKDKTLQIFDDLIVGIPYQKDIERILNE